MIRIFSEYLYLTLKSDIPIRNSYKIDKLKNYEIISFDGDESIVINAINVDKTKPYIDKILFSIGDCPDNKRYKLKLKNFYFEYEHEDCETTEFEFISVSEPPEILRVIAISPINMIVEFTKDMKFNNDILNPNKYKFIDSNLKILKVEKNNETSVKLLTTMQTPGKIYQLKVV